MTCESCHYFQLDHPKLRPCFRGTSQHGLCTSPWVPHKTWRKDSTRCTYWQERESERLQRECPECQARIWKWLDTCPECAADLRVKCKACGLPLEGEPPVCECEVPFSACSPRRKKDNRPDGGVGNGWLRARRAGVGY